MSFPEITSLARKLERSDSSDRNEQMHNLERLRDLRNFVRRNGSRELASCLGAVLQLVEALAGARDSIGRDEIRGMASRLLYTLGAGLDDSLTLDSGATTESRPPARPPAPPQPEPLVDQIRPTDPDVVRPGVVGGIRSSFPHAAPAPSQQPTRADTPSEKPALESRQDPGVVKKKDMTFGRILIALGQVTRANVADALRFHRRTGMRIGECLLMQGVIAPERLLDALKLQERLRATPGGITPEAVEAARESEPQAPPAPAPAARGGLQRTEKAPPDTLAPVEPAESADLKVTEGIFFGEVLLGADMVTNDELEKAMHQHYNTGVPLGEVLVQLGALTPEEVESGLELQAHLRRIAATRAA